MTRVGRFLRRTHLDEIPQLGAILLGQMSVVGPRATWTTEEVHLEARALEWHKRWFIKPGLAGLAQIRDATSADPEAKLRADIEYYRRQSLSFNVKILVRQGWNVWTDVLGVVGEREQDEEAANFSDRLVTMSTNGNTDSRELNPRSEKGGCDVKTKLSSVRNNQ